MNSVSFVQKLWNYYNVMREDGVSYGGCVEQLAHLLFLKMMLPSCNNCHI
jgi:type I restriction enzyme M protein